MSEATVDVDGDVPRPFDRVQLLFKLDDGNEEYWWPAVILHSKESPASATVKGTGRIEYAARRNNKEEQEDVVFLPDRVVSTSNGETTWRTATEAADDGAGDDGDRDWECERRPPVPRRTKRRASGRHLHKNRVCDDDADGTVGDRPESKRQKRSRRGTKSNSGKGTTELMECDRAEQPQVSQDKLSLQHLKGEVEWLKARLQRGVGTSVDTEVEKKIGEKLIIWWVWLEKALANGGGRDTSRGSSRPFSSVLQTGCITVKDTISYETFSQIVASVVRNMDDRQRTSVFFVPSVEELQNPRQNIREGHVVFNSARAMLQWLGIGSKSDVDAAVVNGRKRRNGVSILRVLGGVQWSGQEEDAIRIFVGTSCGASKSTAVSTTTDNTGERQSRNMKVVEFESAKWDGSNNLLAAQPRVNVGEVGEYGSERSYVASKNSVFSLSWNWIKGVEGTAFSASARSCGSYRLGNISLSLPYVMFKGKETCGAIRELLGKINE